MAKPGKVWQILAMNRSQNVVFYRVKNYSCPGVGAFRFAVGAFRFAVGAFSVGAFSVGALLHPCTRFCGCICTHDRKIIQYNALTHYLYKLEFVKLISTSIHRIYQ